MNYQSINVENQTNPSAGFHDKFDAKKAREEIDQQYVHFLMWPFSSINPQNYDGNAAFDEKEHDFDAKKHESEVILSPSSSAQSKKQDDKTKKKAKRKNMPELEDISYSDDEDVVGAEADFNNLESSIPVSPIPTTRIHKDHYVSQIIGDMSSTTQTKSMTRVVKDQGGLSHMFDNDFHTCMFACFLSQKKPKRVHQALKVPSWIEAMQEELLQFKMQKDWVLVDLPYGKRAIENGFQRGTIDQTLFIKKQKGDILLVQIYVDDIIFGATNKDLCKSFEKLIKDKFQMSSMGKLTFFLGLQVKQKKEGIFISQDKYVAEILRKFGLTEGKSASTPIDTEKPLLKDPDDEDVDVHTYRSMIGSLMYLTSSRPDIMFAVCVCVCFQVTTKASHILAIKRIFRYLKGKLHLGLWYPKDSPFDLVAYSDSDYAGVSLDRKSTSGGCQFFGCRLISWQSKKQTVVATSSIEAEYVAAARQTTTDKEISTLFMAGSLPKTILTTFIHYWNTVVIKQYNDVTRLQALIDKKKMVVTEAAVREVLRLDDAEGVDCLPNEEIFVELARMGYEKPSTKLTFYKAFFLSQWKFLIHIILQSMSSKQTSWNEFSSAMASAVICLSTGRKFNFSKYIFDSLVRNVDSSSKFYMYPCFIQFLIRNQLERVIKKGGDAEDHVQDVADGVAAQGNDTDVQRDDAQEPTIPSPTLPTPPPQPPHDLPSTS
nr:uncharacterized mitochondrial protein AtMg00810-like [Tanacetum cinerariifolium]